MKSTSHTPDDGSTDVDVVVAAVGGVHVGMGCPYKAEASLSRGLYASVLVQPAVRVPALEHCDRRL